MSIEQEKMIVEALPSLYPLQKFEEDAIHAVIDALSKESETVYCENCAYAEKYVDGLIFCRRTKTAFRVSDTETCGKGKREVTT